MRYCPRPYAKGHDAVEEIFRYVSPVRTFIRVAGNDYELRGKWIETGQSVMMIYPSANRDEEVVEHPQEFNIERTNNEHVAFGLGPHVGIGLALARLEMRHLPKEFSNRIKNVELTEQRPGSKTSFSAAPNK
jgi:cytochrome P450